jgi:hypothetical protein
MNAVGIDVSKGKSKIAIIRPFGEVVAKPFDIEHFPDQLTELCEYIHSLDGETRVVLEHTGKYSSRLLISFVVREFSSVLSMQN